MQSVPPAHWWDSVKIVAVLPVVAGYLGVAVRFIVLKQRTPRKAMTLESAVVAFCTAATVPGGLFLIGASVDQRLMRLVVDLPLVLAAAGITFLYIAIKSLWAD